MRMYNRTTLPRVPHRKQSIYSDNLVLAPASLLPFKVEWQAIVRSLPQYAVLIILPQIFRATRNGSRQLLVKGDIVVRSHQ